MISTKHTCEQDQRAFGRRVAGCPRCAELANGAAPRAGWQTEYFARKAREEDQRSAAVRTHDCKRYGCLSICVAFDW